MKKTTKKTAVKRAPLKLVKNTPAKKKSVKPLRSFWTLFPKVKNHKFQEFIQPGNYLDEFVGIVEAMPDDQFDGFLQTNPINLREYLKKFRLDRYEAEFLNLYRLIELSNKGRPCVAPGSTNDLLARVFGPQSELLLRIQPAWKKSIVEETPIPFPISQDQLKQVVLPEADDAAIEEFLTSSPVEAVSLDDALRLIGKDPESKTEEQNNSLKMRAAIRSRLDKMAEFARETVSNMTEPMPTLPLPDVEIPQVVESSEVGPGEMKAAFDNHFRSLEPIKKEEGPIADVRAAKKLIEAFEAAYSKLKVARIASKRTAALQLEAFAKDGNEEALHTTIQAELKAKHQFMMIKKVRKALYERFEQAPLDQADVAVFEASTEDMLEALQKALTDHFEKMGPTEETVSTSWMTRSNRKYNHRVDLGYAARRSG